ncbi:hypothetical protein [Vibrio paucivorans]|uniref:Uncharacterized protein n=1 Tax=Vibrio paucivorans TaxID=2829489 RepID=A0A9X3CGK0_9VIBR|nr:hypothetical protein [Vibrio paucivorans]MCW8335326.1 hypothetical protein [Vibrio paucivorans]
MKNNQSIESLKEQLYNADVAYSWEHKGLGGKYEHLWRWGVAFFVNYSIFVFFWFILEDFTVDTPMFWVAFVLMTIMMLMTRYLYLPDKHRYYHLTALGIHYTEQDMVPEVAYKIVRGFAWVGVVVCIIAVFLLGPLALVGAGAFALMSFGMTNFKPTVDKCCLFIDERSVVFNLMNDNVISFTIPEKGQMQYKGLIFTPTLEEKQMLLNHLHSLFHDLEVVKIKRLNDQFKHPIYQQSEDTATE